MAEHAVEMKSFAYQAQTEAGNPISGTIDAPDLDAANKQLSNLRLRVLQIELAEKPVRSTPLRRDDFIAFNQQLAQLTAAGMPIEQGLRLIAQDMRSGRLARTIQQVAEELERGTPLGEAFEKFRGNFPPLYGKLVTAGMKSNNLSGMLVNLGRHLDLVTRLRAALWRAISYPAVVLLALAAVICFLGLVIIPQFASLYHGFGIQLPGFTTLLIAAARWLPATGLVIAVIVILLPVVWQALRVSGRESAILDRVLLPMPLIGPVMERNLIARWCDAVRLGVQAGLDLPGAIGLAGEAIGSPALQHDGANLTAALNSGQALERAARTRLLPATVTSAMSVASEHGDLPVMLGTLSEMYQQQAETRLSVIPSVLTPLLIIIVAIVIGMVILGLFLPFIALLQSLMG